jgi:predicted MFS family arabinose efflux permease/alpha-beta hydrolase superfamily lysophospholipase
MKTALSEPPSAGASRAAVAVACLLILAALIDSQVVAAIAPQIAAGLGSLPTVVASSVTVYAVTAAAVALLLGRFGRRIRPLTWLPLAALVFVGASLLASFAAHVLVFLAARALAGVAGGLISALVIAALADASSYAQRGKQMSGVAISYFLAPVLGVPLGTFLTGRHGWRSVFWAVAALAALSGLLIKLFPLPPGAKEEGTRTETKGDEAKRAGDAAHTEAPDKTSLWKLASRSRSTRMGLISAFFVSGGLVGFTTFLGTWLAEAFRAGPRQIGLIYALAGAGAVAGSVLGGILADRFGKRRVAALGSALMIFCLLLLPTFSWSATLWALICVTAFLAALRVAPLQAIVTEVVAPGERAAYVALRNGASQLGIAAAVAGGGRLYAAYGLAGTGALCAALTFGAWLTIRLLDDPHDHPATNTDVEVRPRQGKAKRRWMRRGAVAALCAVLFVCVVLPFLLSFLITKAGTRPGERDRVDTPAAQGATFEDVAFASTDGNQLSGWYLPSQDKPVTIIMTHGMFRSRYEMLDRGVALWREGYGVLLYDLRRHGRSGRTEFSSIGFNERHDVEAALKFAREREPRNRIVLMGVSMGAAATLLAAAETHDLMAVVCESSFLSFDDTVRHHVRLAGLPAFPFATLLVRFTAWRLNFAPADFDLLQAVKKIKCPILFIGGGADRRMPNESVLEPLYAAATHPLKRKLIVAGAQHGHAYDRDEQSRAEYVKAFTDFLQAVASSP